MNSGRSARKQRWRNNDRLEHIYTFAKTPDLDAYMRRYEKQGFVVGPKAVRHPLGKYNRFLYIGLEYLEFETIEDEAAYRKGKSAHHDLFRKYPGPYGFGFEEQNIEDFHKSLIRRGIKVPALYSRGPAGSKKGEKPWWTFQTIPSKLLPGVYPFVLRYDKRKRVAIREAYRGKNRIFGISGVTFVTEKPEKDAEAWRRIFAHASLERRLNRFYLRLGPHLLEWMTRSSFEKKYAQKPYIPYSGKFASLRKTALIHLLSDNLNVTGRFLRLGRRRVKNIQVEGQDCLYVESFKADGFAFLVHKASPEQWKKERMQFGQKCRFVSRRNR